MQPTNNDNPSSPTTVDATIPTGNDAYATDPVTAPAPVSSAMSDALAATAAASSAASDPTPAPITPSSPLSASADSAPIFGPTSAAESIANDPLSASNNSSAPVVQSPTSEQAIASSVDALVTQTPAPSEPTVPVGAPPVDYSVDTPSMVNDDSLLAMKQDALQQLSPLVSHLDQSPEEKFKTTMMMLQATDNPALVKEAFEYAKQITDEKSRAQALLDVVNEINYFTHQQAQANQPPVFES